VTFNQIHGCPRVPSISDEIEVNPVMFPPGRARLATRPVATVPPREVERRRPENKSDVLAVHTWPRGLSGRTGGSREASISSRGRRQQQRYASVTTYRTAATGRLWRGPFPTSPAARQLDLDRA